VEISTPPIEVEAVKEDMVREEQGDED